MKVFTVLGLAFFAIAIPFFFTDQGGVGSAFVALGVTFVAIGASRSNENNEEG